ncbi:hypothetical protein L7F22_061576 [Adiantum nelumboides]|nr:hypothetical protein [Adiantum nelumboides]
MAMVSSMTVFRCSWPPPRWKHSKGARCLAQGDLSYQLNDGFSSFILPLPPSPVLFPRKNLSRKFAVLLMRSAYDAADELDFIAMDKFQMKFWKLRQSEVEPYTLQYRPLKVKYGDLTDPLYFDFISYAQFATISKEMRNGQYMFQEKIGASGELRTVRRDANILANSKLPDAFTKSTGNLIYSRLLQGFEGEIFNVPRPCPPESDSTCLIEGISKLLQLFVDQGYALNANVEEVKIDKMSNDLILRVGDRGEWADCAGTAGGSSRKDSLASDSTGATGAVRTSSDRTT